MGVDITCPTVQNWYSRINKHQSFCGGDVEIVEDCRDFRVGMTCKKCEYTYWVDKRLAALSGFNIVGHLKLNESGDSAVTIEARKEVARLEREARQMAEEAQQEAKEALKQTRKDINQTLAWVRKDIEQMSRDLTGCCTCDEGDDCGFFKTTYRRTSRQPQNDALTKAIQMMANRAKRRVFSQPTSPDPFHVPDSSLDEWSDADFVLEPVEA